MPASRFVLVGVISAALLVGCTSLSVRSLPATPDPENLPAGFVYYLPIARVDAAAVITLDKCEADKAFTDAINGTAGKNPPALKRVTFKTTGTITPIYERGEAIVVDYRKMSAFLKTSELTWETYPNGMLKTVNASIAGEEPEAIAAVAGTAASIAAIVAGFPAAGAIGLAALTAKNQPYKALTENVFTTMALINKKQVKYFTCTKFAIDQISKRKTATDNLQKLVDKQKDYISQLEGILSKISTPTEADLQKMKEIRDQLKAIESEISDQKVVLTKINAKLSLGLTPKDLSLKTLQDGTPLAPNPEKREQFLSSLFTSHTANVSMPVPVRSCDHLDDDNDKCADPAQILEKYADIVLKADQARNWSDGWKGNSPKLTSVAARSKNEEARTVKPDNGLIYVIPETWKVTIKGREVQDDPLDTGKVTFAETKVASADIGFPQLGRYMSLPVESGFGEKVSLEASFREDGSLEKASYKKPKSAGLAAAATLKNTADQALAAQTKVAEQKLAAVKNETDLLNAQAVLDKRQDLLLGTVSDAEQLDLNKTKYAALAAIAESQQKCTVARQALKLDTTPCL